MPMLTAGLPESMVTMYTDGPQRRRLFVGIDPGLKGAVVALDEHGGLHSYRHAPVTGTRSRPVDGDLAGMVSVLRALAELAEVVAVAVELPADAVIVPLPTVPGQKKPGVRKIYQPVLQRNVGVWCGIVVALGLPLLRPRPQDWQMLIGPGAKGTTKQRSIDAARLAWPRLAREDGKIDDGVADSAWIAQWARVRLVGGAA